jgi:GcrA cell cycle regulator
MPEEEVVIPLSEMVTIMDLKESMCRWPVGDPTSGEFRYCGAKKGATQTGPYCGYHSRVAYQPVQDRRRERRAQPA